MHGEGAGARVEASGAEREAVGAQAREGRRRGSGGEGQDAADKARFWSESMIFSLKMASFCLYPKWIWVVRLKEDLWGGCRKCGGLGADPNRPGTRLEKFKLIQIAKELLVNGQILAKFRLRNTKFWLSFWPKHEPENLG